MSSRLRRKGSFTGTKSKYIFTYQQGETAVLQDMPSLPVFHFRPECLADNDQLSTVNPGSFLGIIFILIRQSASGS